MVAETKTYVEVIAELEKYLELQRDEGVRTVEVDSSVLAMLADAGVPCEAIKESAAPVPAPAPAQPMEASTLEGLVAQMKACQSCALCKGRTQVVPGEGNADAPDVLFIGDGPGADEDAQGRPFVGPAGQLLTKMIEAMGYSREEVFIANSVKCRPPNNRAPLPEEIESCLPYLQQQIQFIRQRIIVVLGATAVKGLLGKTAGITRLRGVWQDYGGVRVMPTYHPSYLLRDPSKKKEVWQDLQKVMAAVGKAPPPRG